MSATNDQILADQVRLAITALREAVQNAQDNGLHVILLSNLENFIFSANDLHRVEETVRISKDF